MKLHPWLTTIFIIILALSACTPAQPTAPVTSPTPTLSPKPTSTPSVSLTPTAGPTGQPALSPTPGATFGQLAEAGTNIFVTRCARCHGMKGEGGSAPALTGTQAQLGKYKTFQGLLNYMSTAMPGNAPGTLSTLEYQQVFSYVTVQNSLILPETQFNAGQLESIPLP